MNEIATQSPGFIYEIKNLRYIDHLYIMPFMTIAKYKSKGIAKNYGKSVAETSLSLRQWEYTECGILHDRDQNAAINTLLVGLGTSLERYA